MNYYNENDPKAAAWLRELIAAGEIAPGKIDERSIKDVTPDDLTGFHQCHFFAGIGGWPDDLPVWTGSCPCQPFSQAGKRKGQHDSRHLWPWFRRLIAQCHPPVAFGEQVASKDGRAWLAGIRANLETLGYAVGAADLCAAGVGAPHIRQRLFWVADATSERWDRSTDLWRKDRGTFSQASCRLGDPDSARPQPGLEAPEATRHRDPAIPDGRPCSGGLGNSASDDQRRNPEPPMHGQRGADRRPGRARDCGLDHACGARLERHPGNGHQGLEPGRLHADPHGSTPPAAWSDFDFLPFRDGKIRRVERGTFPLAHGIPGRVGLLRGYGNAIVPKIAVEFIVAWIEASYMIPSMLRSVGGAILQPPEKEPTL